MHELSRRTWLSESINKLPTSKEAINSRLKHRCSTRLKVLRQNNLTIYAFHWFIISNVTVRRMNPKYAPWILKWIYLRKVSLQSETIEQAVHFLKQIDSTFNKLRGTGAGGVRVRNETRCADICCYYNDVLPASWLWNCCLGYFDRDK